MFHIFSIAYQGLLKRNDQINNPTIIPAKIIKIEMFTNRQYGLVWTLINMIIGSTEVILTKWAESIDKFWNKGEAGRGHTHIIEWSTGSDFSSSSFRSTGAYNLTKEIWTYGVYNDENQTITIWNLYLQQN